MRNEAKNFSQKLKNQKHIYFQFSLQQKLNSRVLQGTIQRPSFQNVLINVKKRSEQQFSKIYK